MIFGSGPFGDRPFGDANQPSPATPAPTGWAPSYASSVPGAPLLVAVVPFLFIAAAILPPRVDAFAWRPTVADAAPGATVHASSVPWYAKPPQAPPVAAFAWHPAYPDVVFAAAVHASQLPYAVAPVLPPPATGYAWRPLTPDFARDEHVDASRLPWYVAPVRPPPVDGYAWRPEYADLAPGDAPHASRLPFAVAPVRPVTVAAYAWRPSAPDAPPPAPPSTLWPAAAGRVSPPVVVAPPLSWAAEYPDFAAGATLPPSDEPALVAEPVLPPPVSAYAWRPSLPDFATASQVHASALPWRAAPVLPPPVPSVSWLGVFPEAARAELPHAARAPYYAAPVAPPVAPLRSWAPSWPDLAPGLWLPSSDLPWVVAESILPPPTDRLGWRPLYPDAVLAWQVHASSVPFLSQARPLPPTDRLAWRPSYPDAARAETVDASRLPWQEGRVAPPQVDAYGWRPSYPDFATAATVHPALVPFAVKPVLPPPVPSLSWSPRYADFAPGASLPPADEPWLVSEAVIPPPVDRFWWRPSAPDFAVAALAHPSAAPWLSAPVRQPLPSGLPWPARYPDVAPGLALPSADLPFVAPEEILPPPVAAFAWRPSAPDFATAELPHASRAPWLSAPVLPPRVDRLGWRPTWPDSARGEALHPSAEPFAVAPTLPPPPPALSWRGLVPDAAPGAAPHPAHTPYLAAPVAPPVAPRSAWAPRYADAAPGAALPASDHPTVALRPLQPPPAPYAAALFPDRLDPPPALGVERQWTFGLGPFPLAVRVDQLGWHGAQPERVERAEAHPSAAPFLFREPFPHPPAPLLSWSPRYADRVEPPPALDAALQRPAFFAPFPLPVRTDQLGWRGEWPDRVERAEPHASQAPSLSRGPFPHPPVVPLAWAPRYPDAVDAAPALGVAAQRAAFLDPAPLRVPVAQFGWRGCWPDAAPGARLHEAAVQAFARPVLPLAPVPPLAWRPAYPDGVVAPASPPLSGASWSPLAPAPPAPPLSWSPVYPDRAERAATTFPAAATLDPFPRPDVRRLGWRGCWPDAVARTEPGRGPSLAQPVPVVVTALTWQPAYPAAVTPAWTGAHLWPVSVRNLRPIPPAPALSWAPSYPDRALGEPPREGPWATLPPRAVAPLGWDAVYPSALDAPPALAAHLRPSEARQPVAPVQIPSSSWAPVYPDFARGASAPEGIAAFVSVDLAHPLKHFGPVTVAAPPTARILVAAPGQSVFVVALPEPGTTTVAAPQTATTAVAPPAQQTTRITHAGDQSDAV